MRCLGLAVLCLIAACNRGALPSSGTPPASDGSVAGDLAADPCADPPPPCEDQKMFTCTTYGTWCSLSRNGQPSFCRCGFGGRLYCNDCRCRPGPMDPGGSYTTCKAGADYCNFDFEQSCSCVLPEHVWACCGGVLEPCYATMPVQGAPCAGCIAYDADGACGSGCSRCKCVGNHWQCSLAPDAGACDAGP